MAIKFTHQNAEARAAFTARREAAEDRELIRKQRLEAQKQQGDLAVQGLRNTGGLDIGKQTGEFSLKEQGMRGTQGMALQGLQGEQATGLAKLKNSFELGKEDKTQASRMAERTLIGDQALKQQRERIAADLFKSGAKGGPDNVGFDYMSSAGPGFDVSYRDMTPPVQAAERPQIIAATQPDLRTGAPGLPQRALYPDRSIQALQPSSPAQASNEVTPEDIAFAAKYPDNKELQDRLKAALKAQGK